MFNFETDRMNTLITQAANDVITDKAFVQNELTEFIQSGKRRDMIAGQRYFEGKHDILRKKRTAIGEGGALSEVDNLPNNHIVNNQYRKMVLQKVNYLYGKPFTMQCEDDAYTDALNNVFNMRFMRQLKNIAKDSLNGAIGWL